MMPWALQAPQPLDRRTACRGSHLFRTGRTRCAWLNGPGGPPRVGAGEQERPGEAAPATGEAHVRLRGPLLLRPAAAERRPPRPAGAGRRPGHPPPRPAEPEHPRARWTGVLRPAPPLPGPPCPRRITTKGARRGPPRLRRPVRPGFKGVAPWNYRLRRSRRSRGRSRPCSWTR